MQIPIYDNAGHLCGVRLNFDLEVIGATFATRHQRLLGVGCILNYWVYDNNVVVFLPYSPPLKEAEAWYGEWRQLGRIKLCTNPIHCGVMTRTFETDKDVINFLSNPPDFPYRAGYLYEPK